MKSFPGHVERLLVLDKPCHRDGSPVAEGVVADSLVGGDALGGHVHGSYADLERLD